MRISDWSSDVCSSDLRVFSDVIPFPSAGIDAPDFQYSRNTDSEAANRCPADECYDAQHVMQPPAQEKPWRNQSAGREIRWECAARSEEHTSELQSLMRISYAVFCLKKKKTHIPPHQQSHKLQIATH